MEVIVVLSVWVLYLVFLIWNFRKSINFKHNFGKLIFECSKYQSNLAWKIFFFAYFIGYFILLVLGIIIGPEFDPGVTVFEILILALCGDYIFNSQKLFQIRENGINGMIKNLKWENINSYYWQARHESDPNETLTFVIENNGDLSVPVLAFHKDNLESLMNKYLPGKQKNP